jgi:DNA-directed RNA polymerase subunit RPC12/RpoP
MLVTVATFTRPWDGHLLRLRLEADGIPAFIADEHFPGNAWHWSLALGGTRVQVPRWNLEEAVATLRHIDAGTYSAEMAEELGGLDEAKCADCGSGSFRSRAPYSGRAMVVLSFLMARAPYFPRASIHRCSHCGHRWSD